MQSPISTLTQLHVIGHRNGGPAQNKNKKEEEQTLSFGTILRERLEIIHYRNTEQGGRQRLVQCGWQSDEVAPRSELSSRLLRRLTC